MEELDKKSVNRIRTAIHGLTETPPEGDIKPLAGSKDGRMRLRVGGVALRMSELAMETARLMNMLPASEQSFAFELVKKLVIAWDPDFTKLTPEEARRVDEAEERGFIDEADIDWSQIGQ